MPTRKHLVRAKAPECVGVSSQTVLDMIKLMEDKGMIYHSLMIVRHGKVAAECYRKPFSRDIPHIMYSVSKTVTATAVGFAISEGLLRLDTRLIDVFPEYLPKKTDDRLSKLEIRHLLTMTAGKKPSYLLDKTQKDWLRQLLDAKWISDPGEQFEYVNENIYALCAVLQRITGESVTDYLYKRFFEPLDIDKPFWETDHKGIESGGWGLFLTTEDLAKIMMCYMQGGKWKGKQIIPKKWAKDATLNQKTMSKNPVRENGYGYCIWIENENEYRADGMYSQISTVIEDKDTVVAVTGCEKNGVAFWEAVELLKEKGFTEENKDALPSREYTEYINSRVIDVIPVSERRSPLEDFISGRTIHFKKDPLLNSIGFPMSVLTTPSVYMTKYRAGNIDNVRLDFDKDELHFTWQENDEINSIVCGMDGEYRLTPISLAYTPYTAAGAAYWIDNYTLEVWIRPVEAIAKRVLRFSFEQKDVVMTPSAEPPASIIITGITEVVCSMFKQKKIKDIAGVSMKKLESVIEPVHHGKIIN